MLLPFWPVLPLALPFVVGARLVTVVLAEPLPISQKQTNHSIWSAKRNHGMLIGRHQSTCWRPKGAHHHISGVWSQSRRLGGSGRSDGEAVRRNRGDPAEFECGESLELQNIPDELLEVLARNADGGTAEAVVGLGTTSDFTGTSEHEGGLETEGLTLFEGKGLFPCANRHVRLYEKRAVDRI